MQYLLIFIQKIYLNAQIVNKRKKDPSLQIDSVSKKQKIKGYKEKDINFLKNKAKHRRDQKRNGQRKKILIEKKKVPKGKVGNFR